MPDLFQTTRWSLIAVASGDDAKARAALEELCGAYWRPVYAFMRRHGRAPDMAADLTQAFFAQVLERRAFARADPSKGRFRSYLLTSARNFLVNAHEREVAGRRGGGARHVDIDIDEAERCLAQGLPAADSTPHLEFERQFAVRLVERTLDRLRAEYAGRGQAPLFEQLQSSLTSSALLDSPDGAGPTGLSPDARRMAVHRLRRRYGELLRAEIADTVRDRADVDDELRHVLRILAS
jgi:RNA polymerase sigma-70 factor (ECF subfamily)